MRLLSVAGICCLVLAFEASPACVAQSNANRQTNARFLEQYCVDCHGADLQEANVRFDAFDPAGKDAETGQLLDRILGVVSTGRMPPVDSEQPPVSERNSMVSALRQQLSVIADRMRHERRDLRNRRLTVEEYHYTMQSLFGVDADFKGLLPLDPIAESGYSNDSGRLGLSSLPALPFPEQTLMLLFLQLSSQWCLFFLHLFYLLLP